MSARGRPNEEESEGYFASISDLMVGILFIFLLMLTVFALNFADEDKDAELRRLRVELDRTIVERDRATEERDRFHIERDQAQVALDRTVVERNRATEERDRFLAERDQARSQRDQVQSERDQAQGELDQARLRLAALNTELSQLVTRVGSIEAELDSAGERLRNVRAQLLDQLKTSLDAQGVKVEVSADVLRLTGEEELFAIGLPTLTVRGLERVTAVLNELGRLLPCYALQGAAATAGCPDTASPIFETVLIEGHTDALPSPDNWKLSTERARAVLDLIQRQHAGLLALRNVASQPMLGLAGYGESRLLPNTPGTNARNRRIELRFLLSPAPEQEAQAIRTELEAVRDRLNALRSQ